MAQLDSASDSDSEGPRFESARVGQKQHSLFDVGVVFYLFQGSTLCKANAVRIPKVSRSEAELSARVGQKKSYHFDTTFLYTKINCLKLIEIPRVSPLWHG